MEKSRVNSPLISYLVFGKFENCGLQSGGTVIGAGGVISTLAVLIVYAMVQRMVIRGTTAGAIKECVHLPLAHTMAWARPQ